jgi:hypothetical protein
MFYTTATPIGDSVGENAFRKTGSEHCEPAHKMDFHGSSSTNRLALAFASYGDELERPEPRQIFRV